MKPLNRLIGSRRISHHTPAVIFWIMLFVLLAFVERTSEAAATVTTCSEADLRAALAGGGAVNFDCDGTITLAREVEITLDTRLDGNGHQITISGNNSVRVFCVATNVNFTMANVIVANGRSTNGAGVLNDGGRLVLTRIGFLSNIATNTAASGTNAASCGGAICNQGGSVIVSNCVFIGNRAFGSRASASLLVAGGDGLGGAIYSTGQLDIECSTFDGNSAEGGAGGPGVGSESLSEPSFAATGGSASGGAIFVLGTANVSRSTFLRNVAAGAVGGIGGMGLTSPYQIGLPGGWGGLGGAGSGSALFATGAVNLINCTIASNTAAGGAGGNGGSGGFGLFGGTGGNGGSGGAALGSICDSSGLLAATNCTIASNSSERGAGGYGGGGGFGVYGSGGWGANGAAGMAVGGLRTVMGMLVNTLLGANSPTNGSGAITDGGHNLSSDGSCAFTGVGSMNDTDPKLGSLANNGGANFTMALLPGSPAINAGDVMSAPLIDQRGVSRPQGPGVDIGAFEYQYVPIFTEAKLQDATNLKLQMWGLLPHQTFTLQTSCNLTNWSDWTNLVAGLAGDCEFTDSLSGEGAARFYRIMTSAP